MLPLLRVLPSTPPVTHTHVRSCWKLRACGLRVKLKPLTRDLSVQELGRSSTCHPLTPEASSQTFAYHPSPLTHNTHNKHVNRGTLIMVCVCVCVYLR